MAPMKVGSGKKLQQQQLPTPVKAEQPEEVKVQTCTCNIAC